VTANGKARYAENTDEDSDIGDAGEVEAFGLAVELSVTISG
jgi:hypothetical protein